VWRALRYVYSVERNRKVFKRLFPPDLFAAFIDVGHYESDIEHYHELDRRFRQLSTAGACTCCYSYCTASRLSARLESDLEYQPASSEAKKCQDIRAL